MPSMPLCSAAISFSKPPGKPAGVGARCPAYEAPLHRRRVPARVPGARGSRPGLLAAYPFRQPLMNFLRSSPFICLSEACLLQSFMRACWGVIFSFLALPPLRHVLMNFLRSSPSIFFAPACSLQLFMRSCCFFCAAVGSFLASFLSCATANGVQANARHTARVSFLMAFLLG